MLNDAVQCPMISDYSKCENCQHSPCTKSKSTGEAQHLISQVLCFRRLLQVFRNESSWYIGSLIIWPSTGNVVDCTHDLRFTTRTAILENAR